MQTERPSDVAQPVQLVMRPSEIRQASAEVMELLTEEHRESVQKSYISKLDFQIRVDAAVAYLAVYTSMAEYMEGDLETYKKVALVNRPWFCGDFDIHLLINAVIDHCGLEETFSQNLYLERLAALRTFLTNTGAQS